MSASRPAELVALAGVSDQKIEPWVADLATPAEQSRSRSGVEADYLLHRLASPGV